ncbi:IS3 family transposase [Micromonospora sp. NPDC000316]|uniref:IS3 family transposase n=1 Tax=Micromonospora sp. NPDC000316 TaxID=3364216 RepID=UPI0036BCFB4C
MSGKKGPRSGGPRARRSFTPGQKLELLAGYEQAVAAGEGGAFLRREGLYSSLMSEWRRARDAGLLQGKPAGETVGRPSAEQAEIARLRRELEVAQAKLARTETALTIMGKAPRALGGHLQERAGRSGRVRARQTLMDTYHQMTGAGITTRDATRLTGIARSSAERDQRRPTPAAPVRRAPANALTPVERGQVLRLLNSAEFVDAAPAQIYAALLDQGVYVASIATMYRVLREHAQVRERRRLARHPARRRPELVADAPGQVYTWDITKLAGPVKGVYYDAYVMIDIYSRYIIGVRVHARESGPLAEAMMREVFDTHGVPHVVHADRGTSMTSKSVADLLEDLTVTRSHSRPKVSNDNPYSEAWFKTMKYAPVFPDRFASLTQARAFMTDFVTWYNHAHRHSGIGLHTPAEVHHGRHHRVRAGREDTLATMRAAHPERFGTTRLLPKILDLPEQVWINKPEPQRQAA